MADVQQSFFRRDDTHQPGAIEPTPTNRRTRFESGLDPSLRGWLIRATRLHAHLCSVVRIYARPGRVSRTGDSYASRAARGDQTLLFDCMRLVGDEGHAIADEILRSMDATPPTAALPGSKDKVAEMRRRAARGESLFSTKDKRTPL
jgi:hypothetical protein